MDLADLKRDMSTMTEEELLAHLEDIRTARRQRPHIERKKKPGSESKSKKIKKALDGITAGDLEKALNALVLKRGLK